MRAIIILLAFITSVFVQAKESNLLAKSGFKEGQHYVRLSSPVRTQQPDKIEVTEVFWYGCGHCYTFEPSLKRWRERLPKEVVFVESPIIWSRDTETHARIFYTSQLLGVLDVMHGAVFDAMHLKKLKLRRVEEIQKLYTQHGIAADDFEKVFNSFGVSSLIKQADARARSYGITGTPEIVVDGTYRISGKLAGSQANMLAVAEYLVCKIDAEKNATRPLAANTNGDMPTAMASFCAANAQ